ncbi:MAG TPA: hypothetical protein PKC43_13945 [Phycisphaerales bacterium]|nr:hypothetical protein [Phycisphaerales bacterium]HMP38536.1 hypothetical protein [Phycisphaerales bacterium]
MATAYTPGLKVAARTRHRVRRMLPIAGEVLVGQGAVVAARDVIARAAMPGDLTPMNVASLLGAQPADVPEFMLRREGERVELNEVIARTRGIFGMFKAECRAKASGTIESISAATGQVIIRGPSLPVEVRAYLAGKVVEPIPEEGVVIEADVALVQGIFGIGGEAFGTIRLACARPDEPLQEELLRPEMAGQIVVGGGRVGVQALRKAREIGVAAVVSGGLDDSDLREFLGYDLGVAITGSEQVGLTLVITEGFGEIAMAERTYRLLRSLEGHEASANGATQIRAGVMRPEVIVPLPSGSDGRGAPPESSGAGLLEIGTPVRIVRDPHFGLIGRVSALPEQPYVLGSGSKARVLEVRFDSGEAVVVPRANVELIEE